MYTIGGLARRANVNADSIRFYERQGLLSATTKTDSGYRLYTDDAVRRIAFIKSAQRCGFSLAELRELLQMHSEDASARVNAYTVAEQKQAEIQETLGALQAMSKALEYLLHSRDADDMADPRRLEENVITALDHVKYDRLSGRGVTHAAEYTSPEQRCGA